MSRAIVVFSFLTVMLISGCGFTTQEPLKTSMPALEGDWTINLNQSGGIMGLSRVIEIRADGGYSVTDPLGGKTVKRKLGSAELSKFKKLVAESAYITTEKPLPSVCADCFVYNLVIESSGSRFSVVQDDISLPNSGLETLVAYLRDLMAAALK